MLLNSYYKFHGFIKVTEKILELSKEIEKINWASSDYARNEIALKDGKIIEFPFVITHSKLSPEDYSYITGNLSAEIIEKVKELYPNCVFVRGEISALLPGANVLPHIDGKFFHKHCPRVHVPLYTNDDAKNVFKGHERHFELYSIYEINNRVMHHAYNHGSTPRVHLIFDLMPVELFNQTDKSQLDVRTA